MVILLRSRSDQRAARVLQQEGCACVRVVGTLEVGWCRDFDVLVEEPVDLRDFRLKWIS